MADALKDVFNKLNKGVKIAKAKTKEITDTIKLKSEIKETEEEIKKKFQRIGEIIFIRAGMEHIEIEEIKKIIEEIENLYRKITDIEKKIEEAELVSLRETYGEDMALCPSCKAVNKAGDKFCVKCGTLIKIESEAKICKTCGYKNPIEAKFCRRCGRPIN
ncbi:MAG: zinc ribbon domain-containing protein [Methanothermobacter tenebrarum]